MCKSLNTERYVNSLLYFKKFTLLILLLRIEPNGKTEQLIYFLYSLHWHKTYNQISS